MSKDVLGARNENCAIRNALNVIDIIVLNVKDWIYSKMMSVSLDISLQLFSPKSRNRLSAIPAIRIINRRKIALLFILIKVVKSHYAWIVSKSVKSTTLAW